MLASLGIYYNSNIIVIVIDLRSAAYAYVVASMAPYRKHTTQHFFVVLRVYSYFFYLRQGKGAA
jgi:hypothetical protein